MNTSPPRAEYLPIDKLRPFEGHPFQVKDDDEMDQLVFSVLTQGLLTPITVRATDTDEYEVISGHRRLRACQKAGIETVPALIYSMDRDAAIIALVDSNLHREHLLPSEKAHAYKMKMDAMRHQGERTELTLGQNVPKFKRTTEAIAQGSGESYKQVQRYIRLTELIPDLLEMVDSKKLNFTTAVDISYIDKQVQGWLYEYICDNGFIKPNQITELRKFIGQGNMTQPLMISILNSTIQVKAPSKKVTFNEKKLTKYFPAHYSSADMERVIVSLLEKWKEDQEVS